LPKRREQCRRGRRPWPGDEGIEATKGWSQVRTATNPEKERLPVLCTADLNDKVGSGPEVGSQSDWNGPASQYASSRFGAVLPLLKKHQRLDELCFQISRGLESGSDVLARNSLLEANEVCITLIAVDIARRPGQVVFDKVR
jgi:hypothetical protein